MMLLPDVSQELVAQARDPKMLFGRGILEKASQNWGRYLLLTMPEPWKVAQPMVGGHPAHVRFVESMDRDVVERVEAGLPLADTVVGLGGGSSGDHTVLLCLFTGSEAPARSDGGAAGHHCW